MHLSVPAGLDRTLSIELVRVTERTAVAAARLRGQGDERAADRVAVEAMWAELNRLPIRGEIVIGPGDRDAAEQLYDGELVGAGIGAEVDIALDPLEGKTICAKNLPNALSVLAVAERGSLLRVPVAYMDKIVIGPGYPDGLVSIEASPAENLARLAKAKGVKASDLTVCILDRPRHARLMKAVSDTGASIRSISDGDVAGVIHAGDPERTGIDMYLGVGGAREGVIAAAAMKCIGGQMQGRLLPDGAGQGRGAEPAVKKVLSIADMVHGDVLFAATGVTDGAILSGVKFRRDSIVTDTIVLRSSSRTMREIRARHTDLGKFGMRTAP